MVPHRQRGSAALGVIGFAYVLGACTSSPPGARDVPYGVSPATVFGAPDRNNVFFQKTGLAQPTGGPFVLATEPSTGHVPSGCLGSTDFDGAEMIVDWSCTNPSRTLTIAGTLVWEGDYYQGDCVTSFTGSTTQSGSFSFANVIVPFRAIR